MTETFTLPGEFGYVILTVIASLFMIIWKAENVVGARKKYEVPVSKYNTDVSDVMSHTTVKSKTFRYTNENRRSRWKSSA